MGYKYVKKRQKDSVEDTFNVPDKRVQWSNDKKQEAVDYFLSCGNKTQTALALRIPIQTINFWGQQDWWRDAIKEKKHENIDRTDAKITAILDLALAGVEDRIVNGETVYDPKTGKERVVPAKLRDLNTAFTTLLDKRQLLRKEPTKIVEQKTTADQLKNLAVQFEQFVTQRIAKDKLPDTELIEGDTVLQDPDTGEWHVA